jgi:putative membrane protein
MRPAVLLAVVPLLIATPTVAQQGSSAINQSGKEFLDFVAEVNQSEIQGGLAAEKKAEAPAVRAFARLMVLDHMELESQLAAVAMESGVQLPSEPGEQSKQEMATLQSMSGAKFDTAYMQHMVQGHQQAVQKFKSEKGQAQSQPVEAVVGATLPIIEQHLALAQAVLSEINNQASGTTGSVQSPNASSPSGTTGGQPSSMHRNGGTSRQ